MGRRYQLSAARSPLPPLAPPAEEPDQHRGDREDVAQAGEGEAEARPRGPRLEEPHGAADDPLPVGEKLREDPPLLVGDAGDPRDRGAEEVSLVLNGAQDRPGEVLGLRASRAVP